MRTRSLLLLPVVALATAVLAVGCGKTGTPAPPTDPSNTPGDVGADNPNADVGAPLYAAAPVPATPAVKNVAASEPLLIPNCTVQFENRQVVSAEVDGKIDLIAVKPRVLAKGTPLLKGSPTAPAAGTPWLVTVFDPARHPGAKPTGQLQDDTLVYDRKPDGALVLIPGKIFLKGTPIVEWRNKEKAAVPFDPHKTYPMPKATETREVTLKVDEQAGPCWQIRERDSKDDKEWRVSQVPLERWPDNSLIGEVRADGSVVMADPPAGFDKLVLHPRDRGEKVLYRRLTDGAEVHAGQEICFLDDQMVTIKRDAALQTKAASEAVRVAATKGVDLSIEKLGLTRQVVGTGAGAKAQIVDDTLTLTRFQENLAQAIQTIAKADSDYKEQTELMRRHRIVSSLNGTVKTVAKRPGETVRVGERIMDIEGTDTVRLEGQLDVQYAGFVKRGMVVTVEPAVPSAPIKFHMWHRQAVTGIAVTPHPESPLVVSTSADGTVIVWSPFQNEKPTAGTSAAWNLPHPGIPVRSVACSPAGVKQILAITGADDGKVRLWDLTDKAKPPTAPLRVGAEAHGSAVGVIAFSPSGEFFASAAGREVFVWRTATGERLYALPMEHRDNVTAMNFSASLSPTAPYYPTLVTVSKDRTIKVWKLGADKAAVASTIDHRSGAVDVLGVSPDGGQILFDQSKTRLDLVNLADRQTVGRLQNLGATASFATLALFSPKYDPREGVRSSEYIATAGGEGELKGAIQVWTRPQGGGRGAELARLLTPGRVGVTAAAFSAAKDRPFLVAGTEMGTVHLWTPPPAQPPKHEGTVVTVDFTDPRYATVRVELDNRVLNLPDRSAATVIVNPGQ